MEPNKCLYCNKEVKNKYCNASCQNRHLNPLRRKERIIIEKECLKCNSKFNVKCIKGKEHKAKLYCSRSCANVREHSDETKQKIKQSIDKYYLSDEFISKPKLSKPLVTLICRWCNKEFKVKSHTAKVRKYCSLSCSGSISGRKSAQVQSETRRSKNEMGFANLCINEFNIVLTNEPIFNGWDADVIIEDYKIAVLWNGKWHYEKITEKHSVKQVQNRDRIKIKEIKEMGYIPYIIKDMGRHSINKIEEEFKKFKEFIKYSFTNE